jgi:hypothetical protein
MQIASLHADARADERGGARPDLLERRLARYQPRFRPRVLALAARHPRLKDLALSFPALLFALAVPRAGYDRERVCARVIDGARLRELAAMTQLPLWLRRLPPEAFDGPIPLLPDGPFASRQIVNHIPRSPKKMSAWLNAMGVALAVADEGVAMWMARAWAKDSTQWARDSLRWICVWAWYARHVSHDPCKLKTPWRPDLSLDSANGLASEWRSNIELYVQLGDEPLASVWLKPGYVGGFDIVPLLGYADVVDEAMAMRHCVRWYGTSLAENACRLWSIRRDGERVATFEIVQANDSPFLHIAQLKLADNKRAAAGIWNIAQMWLRAQDAACHEAAYCPAPVAHAKAWRRMWRPYWLAKRRFPEWLPLTPTYDAVGGI